ncbi:hypothetical protein F5144DRAFT_551811 [Chaetomium tenue]|uniref:Uncharacterized protein n=1 Tax=Chaetomium tenue TaxID=1854479 RepID=A0ACB7P0J5_9PEZI|nr:hypothetical protein F5144DRAFT_551811 [Chaetomium globosum]
MGARFSKVSCTCTIDCHQPGVVHDHSNGAGSCQRCNHLRRLRAGAQSRASAASTSTEYLARPRYLTSPSPDPDLARRLIPNPTIHHRRILAQRRARPRRRAASLPSFVSTTTTSGLTSSSNPATRTPSLRPNPSPTPSPTSSTNGSLSILSDLTIPGARARRNTVAGFARQSTVGNANANANGDGGVHNAGAVAAIEASAPTQSNISQSSTAVWRGSEGGRASLGQMVVYTGGEEQREEDQSDWGFWA